MVTCKQCLVERDQKDFYHQNICYECVYKNKTRYFDKRNPKLNTAKSFCKICAKQLEYKVDSYCSKECAKSGKDIHNKNYWTRKCNAPKVRWKN